MKISTKGRYALRMLVDLAEHKEEGFIALKDIAKRQGISKKYLEQIVSTLNNPGILVANRGYQGGYMLAKPPTEYTVGSILQITEGGLDAPAAMYLAAAGVGTIGIADADEVDLSNLQRQVIHKTNDLGKPKVESAKETMQAINPDVNVITYHDFIASDNIMDIIKDYDFILDE